MPNRYDYIIIGAGSAGLTAAGFARQLGARVALVEKDRLGGDCTWTGCVPSKALLKVAKIAHQARIAAQYGIEVQPPQVNMSAVRAFIDRAIDDIYQHETPDVLASEGIDVILGAARFLDPHTIQVGQDQYQADNFLLATGATPIIPPIKGLEQVPYLTYEQIFDNEVLPERLLVLGGGPIGVEIGQAYQRLGSQVTLIAEAFLPPAGAAARAVLRNVLAAEGMTLIDGWVESARITGTEIGLSVKGQTGRQEMGGDCLLVAAGRQPTTAGLGLDNAGVTLTDGGVTVNGQLQTSQPHIYAAGDCIGGQQFTHLAGWEAFQATRNALLPGKASGKARVMPWVIFTDPEVAQVGLTAREAELAYGAGIVTILERPLSRVDRAVADNAAAGFIKVIHDGGTILGATVVAERAGEVIAELALAMQFDLSVRDVAGVIHPYPTYGIGVQRLLADAATATFVDSWSGRLVRRLAGLDH